MFCSRVCQILLCAVLVVPAIAAGQAAGTGSAMITGTITYQVRMALAPEAAIDVRLEDISVADAPAKVVAENVFSALGQQVPIPFRLHYSAQDIQPSHRYAIRARITLGENLLFTTTQIYPVLTNGAPSQVALLVQPAGAQPIAPAAGSAPAPPGPAVPNALRGTKWMLIELNGKPVTAMNPQNPAYLVLAADQKRYSGSSGCNSITGTFQISGDSLQLLGGAMTLMACPDPIMNQEKEFSQALTDTGSYRIEGNTLELLARKKVVAKFQAATATN
jgi:putative lipoprotein